MIAFPEPGSFALEPSWLGREKIVARTGLFLDARNWQPDEPGHALRFNLITFFKTDFRGEEGRCTLSHREADNTLSDLYQHRDRLPENEQITSCHSRKEFKELLGTGEGLEVWGEPDELHTSETWRFFTLKDASTVQTVAITAFFTHRSAAAEWTLDGLRIARGTAIPARKR